MLPPNFRSRFPKRLATVFLLLALFSTLGGLGMIRADINKSDQQIASVGTQKYPHNQVNKVLKGSGASAYWVYSPASPIPSSTPVVLFLHGWMAMDPYVYGGWIDHLVRSGSIVIYPVFQTSKKDTPESILQNTIAATLEAVKEVNSDTSIRPNWNNFSIVGHSLGGGLSVQVAAQAESQGLPMPQAIMSVEPGWQGKDGMPTADLKKIPDSVSLLIIEGADDQFKETRQGRTIYNTTSQISSNRKLFVVLGSNDSNFKVDHSAPLSPLDSYRSHVLSAREQRRQNFNVWLFNLITGTDQGQIDAVDYNGFWPLFDNLRHGASSSQKGKLTINSQSSYIDSVSGSGTPDDPQKIMISP